MSSTESATRTKKGHCGHPGCTRALFARGKCYRHDMEDRGLRKKPEDDDDDNSPSTNNNNSNSPTTNNTTPAPSRRSTTTTTNTNSSAFKDKNKQPLCICPECDKKLTSMRGLFGHYGVKHRTQVNHEEITYACPFCVVDPNDEECEFEVFEGVEELETHVLKEHKGCSLLSADTVVNASPSENSLASSRPKRNSESTQLGPTGRPKRTPPQAKLYEPGESASSGKKPSSRESTSSATKKKANKQSLPLCKCPSCDKVLAPQGIYGHFGRVHSGQLDNGDVSRFEWSKVRYACPFCPSSDKPKIFSSLDTLETHVDKNHAVCEIIRPNMNPKGTAMKSDKELAAAATKSSRESSRKSERERQQRTSLSNEDYEDVPPEVKPTYDCPKCDKKGMTKQGLHTHYGMVHGGKVNMKQVKVNRPGKSRRAAAAKKVVAKQDTTTDDDSGDGYRIGPWSDEEHNAFIEGHKKFGNRWKLISEEFVPTRDAKQIGSHALNYFTTRGQWNGGRSNTAAAEWEDESSVAEESVVEQRPVRTKKGHKRGGKKAEVHSSEEGDEDGSEVSDDGNSGYCIVCYDGGEIICCSKCPRAYHSKCLAKDGGNSVSIDYLPRNWRCKRCKKDKEVQMGEELANKFYAFGDKKIRSAYADYKGCSDFATCCALLSMISEILTKLKNYDYGYYFSEPVDMESVTDYLDFVDTPMDYNIISERLESGTYADHIISTDGEKSIMEDILLHVLCDIDRVHRNCKVYNEQGACGTKAILRVGEIHRSKWNAFFRQYIADRLPEKVQDDYHDFRQKGEFGGKGSAAKRKKRRSSQGEEQRKSKRAKQDASTSALLLSAGQVSALEHVFFASPAVLQQESDAEDAKAQASLGDASSFSASISTELSKSFGPERVSSTLMDGTKVSTRSTASKTESTANQKSWFERLRDLKVYKISHGTAVCTPAVNEKLYHWRLRQRKRYHLTLNRLPQLRSEESQAVLNGRNEDRQWLLTVPEMKGVYSLSSTPMTTIKPRNFAFNSTDGWSIPFIREEDVSPDNQTAALLRTQHELTLYGPESSRGSPRNYWNWYRTSLFWDECMEGLRFFYDEHQHTIVPRSDPEPIFPLWVESQRAKYLLQQDGVWSGLTPDQINALKEAKIADFSTLCEDDDDMEGDENSYSPDYEEGRHGRKMNVDSESKKSWGAHLNDFKVWYQSLSDEEKPHASDLLAQTDWSDYSWCWRQCHAASALLCGTPNVKGITMSVKKLKLLARAGFFRAFPYNGRESLVDEDDYEGNTAFDSTFHTLEDFSIKYGSTHIPDWYDCDAAFRMWISALHNGIVNFAKGDSCVLSTPQIEKLILIGFCNDRDDLSNLSRGDVIWLKNLFELKRYRDLFGDCNVPSDFPHLHEWVNEQKELFRLTRAGKRDMIHASRLEMLRDAGVDFFTGECLPNTVSENEVRSFCQFISSPDNIPADDNSTQNDLYWKGRQFNKDFEALKSRGTSSVLANEHEELYRWFVERRGKLLLLQKKSVDGSLWDNYFERLAMFKAAEGHLNIPDDYPDKSLLMWLSRQQDILHLYSAGQPLEILPTQLKKLIAIGVCESKRMGPAVKMSSRTMKRKFPS
eukprot:CAMPEP_0113417350 /NCGR_PEP_ID=MMETSP0013_2-20120614/25602_1 /TAXON_ID=2843 ORGANISM="Skeletonema costatum, Strain 1716" /NCGR_SAMPLE_ID=MMETSP0013_2 /ASSEMBLY_ACC=CAM_ASM_000158 /LENGTH=1594 /DNA_ID=CAMNT_0000304465 /DNA_START=260 /DNA_END=5040 /DNA_ORIENTATION=- /assembly_acc=CAM_ASM_000158